MYMADIWIILKQEGDIGSRPCRVGGGTLPHFGTVLNPEMFKNVHSPNGAQVWYIPEGFYWSVKVQLDKP